MDDRRHVVMWSGGITSWAVARIVSERHGTENLTLLFADTRYEDADLYRWNEEASAQIGVPLTVVADGRDPWQVFNDKRYIGNTRIAPCSELLKQVPCRTWLRDNTVPENTTVYVGIDWTETHRLPPVVRNYRPWTAEAPLTEDGFRRDKDEWLTEAQELGLAPPRLYALGWQHNNCGGRCIKGGQAQWAHLLKVFPERFAEVEAQENALRRHLGADVAFLRDRRGGETKPLPLTLLRTRLQSETLSDPVDTDDWGGCGCLPESDEEEKTVENDPFAGPDNTPDPHRSRPEVVAGYGGECAVCYGEYDDGELIRACADGSGWEVVEHDHDPEESMPVPPVHVVGERAILPQHGPYVVPTTEEESMPVPPVPLSGDVLAQVVSGLADLANGNVAMRAMHTEEESMTTTEEGPAQFSCPVCPATYAPTKNQRVRTHKHKGMPCDGGGQTPLELREVTAAPLLTLLAEEVGNPGTVLSLDPDTDHVDAEQQGQEMSPAAREMHERVAAGPGPGPNPHRPRIGDQVPLSPDAGPVNGVAFSDGVEQQLDALLSPPSVAAVERTAVFVVSPDLWEPRGQEPEPGRDRYDRYILPHPVSGKLQSWRRVTTFASVLDSTYNLDAWQRRHLLRGAAMYPDKLAGVARLEISPDNHQDKELLNQLADELAYASGVKEAAEQGTYVHTLTEGIDRSTTPDQRNAAFAAVPHHYLADTLAYTRQLDRMGLRVVPSLLERRTVVTQYGLAGTFDQVLYVVRDIPEASLREGDFVVGDKKTGSTVSYGALTHAIQLSQYAHGINDSGIWDAFTGRWTRPVRVREDVGIIIHLPLRQGECTLHVTDLTEGWKAAQSCQAVFDWRTRTKARRTTLSRQLGTTLTVPKEIAPAPAPIAAQQVTAPSADGIPPEPMGIGWQARVAEVSTRDRASLVYTDAVNAGMSKPVLTMLTEAMQRAIAAAEVPAPGVPSGIDVTAAGYWIPQADRISTPADAKGLYDSMIAAGISEDVKAVVANRMTDRLASLAGDGSAPETPAPSPDTWEALAESVTSREQASQVYAQAQTSPHMTADRLKELVRIMQDALVPDPPF